jgi:hypothetical protein
VEQKRTDRTLAAPARIRNVTGIEREYKTGTLAGGKRTGGPSNSAKDETQARRIKQEQDSGWQLWSEENAQI